MLVTHSADISKAKPFRELLFLNLTSVGTRHLVSNPLCCLTASDRAKQTTG